MKHIRKYNEEISNTTDKKYTISDMKKAFLSGCDVYFDDNDGRRNMSQGLNDRKFEEFMKDLMRDSNLKKGLQVGDHIKLEDSDFDYAVVTDVEGDMVTIRDADKDGKFIRHGNISWSYQTWSQSELSNVKVLGKSPMR